MKKKKTEAELALGEPITPEQIIAAALAPPAATLRMTDDTTDAELSAFIRGRMVQP